MMLRPHYWELMSRKVRDKLVRLPHMGAFTAAEAEARGMRFVMAREGRATEEVCLYWLVDTTDGVVADARYQAFGPPALLAAAEIASEMAMRKNYNQVSRFTADLLDQQVRDRRDVPAFPKECYAQLNLILGALEKAVEQCLDLPTLSEYQTPIGLDSSEASGGIPGWEQFATKQKLALIEEVIEKEIRPYIELDAGGVKVLDLLEDRELIIAYEGSCTSCYSSTGSTLSAIQQILQSRIHPSITVTPKL